MSWIAKFSITDKFFDTRFMIFSDLAVVKTKLSFLIKELLKTRKSEKFAKG